MYFSKYPHKSNFSFASQYDEAASKISAGDRKFDVELKGYAEGISHLRISNKQVWECNKCLSDLNLPKPSNKLRMKLGKDLKLSVHGKRGKTLLKGAFGVSGEASLFCLEVSGDAEFLGMGEKSFGRLELSGLRAKFWNTDVWGDFHSAHWLDHPTDPSYLSVPYLILKLEDEYVGLLLHNPYPSFIETPGKDDSRVFVEWQKTSQEVILGTEGGEPNLWILYGTSLRDLTRKLQNLVGVTPLPPIWALGYHQSRWGYGGHNDLLELDSKFAEHKIPCDSLWLDLDYMDGYRIFQTSEKMFPEGAATTAQVLAENGRRMVPILDPGVKFEPGYSVYDDGHKNDVFCKNVEGKEFVGLVWPGETVFPDFTQSSARAWWARYVKAFADCGFGATWLDMNDPSTGPVDPQGMLFNGGKESHATHHNQYALGMQIASRDGLLQSRPEERPFLLSRSGFIGTSKYSAIWTGDNLSNYFYLKTTIPTSVNLSLSGVPFNGPDIGGFGSSTTDELMIDWMKANFLFPFFRNHCTKGERGQEPFAFDEPTMSILRRYIRLRYKLLPYLYSLFIAQEEHGDPILRPMLYEFEEFGLQGADDQFLVGPWVLQAPFLDEKQKIRAVLLPGSDPWYEAASGDWVSGEQSVKSDKAATPLYVRAGAIVPMQAGTPLDNAKELLKVYFHVFVPPAWSGESKEIYKADDGISFAYREGVRSSAEIRLASAEGNLAINFLQKESGFGAIEPTFIIHGSPKSVRLNGGEVKLSGSKVVLTGKPLKVLLVRSA